MLRWIDQLNGVVDADEHARTVREEIKYIKKQPVSARNKKRIKQLYEELDEIQFKPDYMCLIIDRVSDYRRACKGFSINGIKYARLLGTNGGVKTSTIVFVSERIAPELRRRIDNGRDTEKELVPAKFEAYRALTCSGTIPVSSPNGIIVVDDCTTNFTSDIVRISDENGGEPTLEYVTDAPIELDESDGYGIMLPSLAERWSQELDLDYTAAGFNTRYSWEKGMVFCFDYLDFAEQVSGSTTVVDAWGTERDVRDAELILTTSMVKLWDSYDSIDSYLDNCDSNDYTFGISKTTPKCLDEIRNLNYQFIQSYDLTDDQISELTDTTMKEIDGAIGADPMKSLLFMCGTHMDEKNFMSPSTPIWCKAIMANKDVVKDPFIRRKIYEKIQKRITDAKVGVIDVSGNFAVVSGDPYALCQKMFGLPVTGLLEAGEIYHRFWEDRGTKQVACFRAPMTCAPNIRLHYIKYNESADYWYRYMNTVVILNAWDTTAQACNGLDKDGDLLFTTDNPVIVENTKKLPAIVCVQKKAAKKVVSEDDLIEANIASFGDEIGKITNRVTTMFDIRQRFDPESEEYKMLDYRIMCGQHYQQCAIDKAKGIISNPMPKEWYDRKAVYQMPESTDEEKHRKKIYESIVADKKPYFMRHIYPELKKDYNKYVDSSNRKSLAMFGSTVDELLHQEEMSEEEFSFVKYYDMLTPVGYSDCLMNRLCSSFEDKFDKIVTRYSDSCGFDYSLYCPEDVSYNQRQYQDIKAVYKEYQDKLIDFSSSRQYMSGEDAADRKKTMVYEFKKSCFEICPDENVLCSVILDICYKTSNSKQFVWDICGETMVGILLNRNCGEIEYPVECEDGCVEYGGKIYTPFRKKIGVTDE